MHLLVVAMLMFLSSPAWSQVAPAWDSGGGCVNGAYCASFDAYGDLASVPTNVRLINYENGTCGVEPVSYSGVRLYAIGTAPASMCYRHPFGEWRQYTIPDSSPWSANFGVPPPPPVDPLVCTTNDSETACLTRRLNALIDQVSPAEPYDAISGFGFFSLTMGGVLFTYFFSIGIGLVFKAVKEW